MTTRQHRLPARSAAEGEIQVAVRQTGTVSAPESRRVRGPLRSRTSWVASGLILQAVGAGGVAAMTLFVAVPLAAVAGMLVLGVLAFIVALLVAALENGDLDFGLDFSGDCRRTKRPRQP